MNNVKNPIDLNSIQPLCKRLRLPTMFQSLTTLCESPSMLEMTHLEVVHEILEAEICRRDENALKRRLKDAHIRHQDATMADIDFKIPSLNFAQGYLQKKKLVFTGNKGQNLPDFGLYY